jgi:hypothetical protein
LGSGQSGRGAARGAAEYWRAQDVKLLSLVELVLFFDVGRLLVVTLRARSDRKVILREDICHVGHDFVVDDRFVFFADNPWIDTESLRKVCQGKWI